MMPRCAHHIFPAEKCERKSKIFGALKFSVKKRTTLKPQVAGPEPIVTLMELCRALDI